MEESKVYSLESLTSSQFEKCSRGTLIAVLAAYARLYLLLDGQWYLSVKQRCGDAQAVDIDLEVWDKQTRKEITELVQLIDFQNRDVVSFMELSVMMPSTAGSEGYIEIKDRNDCTLTITHCPIVRTLEKEGEGREKTQCRVICQRIMATMAQSFNPGIKVKPVKIPPRQHQDEIYCQWQFKLNGA